uniref:Uncharacterized protein n=1 Tax=Romanomermis culicivorax TaxID=13658 RepID=A0A915JN97_ROMCU
MSSSGESKLARQSGADTLSGVRRCDMIQMDGTTIIKFREVCDKGRERTTTTTSPVIEARAEKVLAKKKPDMHPFHATEEKVIRQLKHDHPEWREEIQCKNDQLNVFLKQVKVKSQDALPLGKPVKMQHLPHSVNRLLESPDDKNKQSLDDYGLPLTPVDRIPPGKLSFHQAVELLQLSLNDKLPADELNKSIENYAAEKFKLDAEKTRLILKYYKPFVKKGEYEHVNTLAYAPRLHTPKTREKFLEDAEKRMAAVEQQHRDSILRIENVNREVDRCSEPMGDTETGNDGSAICEPNPTFIAETNFLNPGPIALLPVLESDNDGVK